MCKRVYRIQAFQDVLLNNVHASPPTLRAEGSAQARIHKWFSWNRESFVEKQHMSTMSYVMKARVDIHACFLRKCFKHLIFYHFLIKQTTGKSYKKTPKFLPKCLPKSDKTTPKIPSKIPPWALPGPSPRPSIPFYPFLVPFLSILAQGDPKTTPNPSKFVKQN